MFSLGLLAGIMIGAVVYREGYRWALAQKERERKRMEHRERVREFEEKLREREENGVVWGRVI